MRALREEMRQVGSVLAQSHGAPNLKAHRADLGRFGNLSEPSGARILACLLAAAVGVGTLDIAMQASFANSATTLPKYQDRPPERQVTSASLNSPKLGWPIFPEAAGIHTLVDYAFSSVQPTNSYDLVEAVEPEEQTKLSAQEELPTELVEAEPVPLPTRKPKKATATSNNSGGERVHVASKRLSQARARKSKQMKFGTIGFNYAGPAM